MKFNEKAVSRCCKAPIKDPDWIKYHPAYLIWANYNMLNEYCGKCEKELSPNQIIVYTLGNA